MVFPSDSSNYKVSYKDGERISKDGEITPAPPPSNPHSTKDFKKILDRDREKKSALSKSAKEDEAEDNLKADNSTEIDSSDGDLSLREHASVQDKITPFPYLSKTEKKAQNFSKAMKDSPADDVEFSAPVGKDEGDVAILPVFPQPMPKAKVKSDEKVKFDENVVIDSDLIKELTEKMTDSLKPTAETKSSTTAKASKTSDQSGEKDLSTGKDITDLDAIAVLPQPTIQPIQKNIADSSKETQDSKDKVQVPANKDLPVPPVAINVPKPGIRVKTDQEIPHLISSADLAKRSNSGEPLSSESPFALFATQGRPVQRDGVNSQATSNTSFTSSKDVSAAGKGRVSSLSTEEDLDVHVTANPLSAPLPVAANASVAESPKTTPVLTSDEINSIVDQIEKLYIASTQGGTETSITLRHPPLFEGAIVIIKTTVSAPNEFNLSFENLSQAAQKVLDSSANQASLRSALFEDKGLTLQMVTATTLIETYDVKSGESQGNRSNDQGKRGDDNQQSEQQNKKKQR